MDVDVGQRRMNNEHHYVSLPHSLLCGVQHCLDLLQLSLQGGPVLCGDV